VNEVDESLLILASSMLFGVEEEDDSAFLREAYEEAHQYVSWQPWCRGVREEHLGFTIPGVVAVFLVRIWPADPAVDESLWVVVGDLPTAYLVTDNAPNGIDALDGYCELMDEWVAAVRSGRGRAKTAGVFPVEAKATRKNADSLASRVAFLREHVIPARVDEQRGRVARARVAAPPIRPGDHLVTAKGDRGIAIRSRPRPTDEWLRIQRDSRWRDNREPRWWTVLPETGGSMSAPESLLESLGPASRDVAERAYRNANFHARTTLWKMFPAWLVEPERS